MEEIDVNTSLLQQDLFGLFHAQLKKDFEGSGIDASFADTLPQAFDALRSLLVSVLERVSRQSSSALPSLLYRVDISEAQLNAYRQKHPDMEFEALLAELIIRRVLQKVILKKTFSK